MARRKPLTLHSSGRLRRRLIRALGLMIRLSAILALVLVGFVGVQGLAAAASSPEETVSRLYRDFAWEVVMANPRGTNTLLDQTQTVLQDYFTPQLAAALRADSKCAAANRDICALEYSPIWSAPDAGVGAIDLKLDAGSQPGIVLVHYKVASTGHIVELKYHLVRLPAGWRIADVFYPGGVSLRSDLRVP